CAFAVIRWLLLPPWREETTSWGPRSLEMLFELLYGTFADVLLLYLSVVVAAHAYAYFVHGQRQEIQRLELRQSLAQSELRAPRGALAGRAGDSRGADPPAAAAPAHRGRPGARDSQFPRGWLDRSAGGGEGWSAAGSHP